MYTNNIRLKKEIIEYLKELGKKIFNSKDIWIFGSRVEIEKKGGDIDIYIETKEKDGILSLKIEFLREFEKRFGEQKVDLIINNFSNDKSIYHKAKEQGIKLC